MRALGIPVLYQAQTVAQAVDAAKYADAIVAQGNESGGHGMNNQALAELVPAINQALPTPIPVLAAGGISTGHDVRRALGLVRDRTDSSQSEFDMMWVLCGDAQGAAGVSLGTRFCLSHESTLPQAIKERMLRAQPSDTIRSTVFDIIRY